MKSGKAFAAAPMSTIQSVAAMEKHILMNVPLIGKTYSNECAAYNGKIKTWTKGACQQ